MSDLAQLSLTRVSGQLPLFPGATLRDKLIAARSTVHGILLKYVPDLKFDVGEARDVMSQVNAWVDRNQADLQVAMKSTSQTLPEYLVLNMGSADRVQQWVIANYTVAASGLGPWDAGKIDKLVADPASEISAPWAMADGQTRLNVFGMLVKMENNGELAYIFKGPATGAQGFGAFPVWAVIVLVISFAAVVAYFYLESRKLELNNALMRDICEKAQAEGDTATVEKCVEATRDLQLATPWQGLVQEAGKVALILGGGWLAFRYALPWAIDKISERRPAT